MIAFAKNFFYPEYWITDGDLSGDFLWAFIFWLILVVLSVQSFSTIRSNSTSLKQLCANKFNFCAGNGNCQNPTMSMYFHNAIVHLLSGIFLFSLISLIILVFAFFFMIVFLIFIANGRAELINQLQLSVYIILIANVVIFSLHALQVRQLFHEELKSR